MGIERVPVLSEFSDPMRDAFRQHVVSEGIAAVDAIKESALVDPKNYIDAVLTVYKKYSKVVLDAFVSRVEHVHVLLIWQIRPYEFPFKIFSEDMIF